jgi:predicted lipid-binding transport protein (Tim44 family)
MMTVGERNRPDLVRASMMKLVSRRNGALFALAGAVALLAAGVAEARPGKGSIGSRGSRTHDAPAATRTAPQPNAPITRSQTPQPGPAINRPGQPPVAAPARSGFGRGFMAGLLGAGLLGLLFGGSLFGALGSLSSFIGLLLQVALIGGLVWLALRFFRGRRQEPALAGAGAPLQRTVGGGPVGGQRPAGMPLGGAPGATAPQPVRRQAHDAIGIQKADYDAFERTLVEVNAAYTREDVAALWNLATPEMAGYFQEQINDNARRGVINKTHDVRLLQGDLAEAWREGETDYATVAMRFSLYDATFDRATNRVVEGDTGRPVEATEIWTFRRDRGGPWKLSAIQQA